MIKLLSKQEISKIKSSERKQEIEEGAKLAKKIDSLRETAAKEETNLGKFRIENLRILKADIDGLCAKKTLLEEEVKGLEEARILAQAPLNLIKAWSKVKTSKIEIEGLKTEIFERETSVTQKETNIEVSKNAIASQLEEIKEKQDLADRYVMETKEGYIQAENVREAAESEKKNILKELSNREITLREKEARVAIREREVDLEQAQIQKDKQAIKTEQIHIASQQQTLRQAWQNIKRLNNK